jgi:hypothetical protein
MTEVPEHLVKRAQEAKAKAAAKKAAAAGEAAPDAPAEGAASAAPAEGAAPAAADSGKIPAHLLERSKSARDQAGAVPAEAAATAPAAAAVAPAAPPPQATGPGGHTQRLLTVVKAGSIQDVKAKPQDKVHVWPHLLVVEFVLQSLFVSRKAVICCPRSSSPNPAFSARARSWPPRC